MLFFQWRGRKGNKPDNCQNVSWVWIYGTSDSGFVQIQLWVVVASHSDCRSNAPLTQIRKKAVGLQFLKLYNKS